MTIKGFLFDFDGIILDTELIHFQSWQKEFESYGFSLPLEDWLKTIGTDYSLYHPAKHLSSLTNGKADAQLADRAVMQRCAQMLEGETLMPGVEDFIKKAYANNIPLAVASSSPRTWVTGLLETHHLTHYFQRIVCSDEVQKVKPDPALYQIAARDLGIASSEGLAFEDSLNGLKAAKAAGLYCYAIPNAITSHLDLSAADKVCKSFLELDPLVLASAN